MISLTQFRAHCLPIFRLMKDTGIVFDIVYKDKVYELSVTPTEKTPQLTRPNRKAPVLIDSVKNDTCPACGGLTFNDICMDSSCKFSKGVPKDPTRMLDVNLEAKG